MIKKDALVTVIITTFGDPSPLDRSITSVLEQTYDKLELIIVDDNGDNTANRAMTENIMSKYSSNNAVKYIKHSKNMNGSASRNTGIRNALGEYIAFLDNDDVYLPDKVATSVRCLETHSFADCALDNVVLVSDGAISKIVRLDGSELSQRSMLLNEGLIGSGSNIFMRKTAINDVGLFDESFVRNQDVEYMIRFFRDHAAIASGSIGIVKTDDGNNNVPPYLKMKMVKNKLHNVFSDDYNALSDADRVTAMQNDARVLLRLAIASGSLTYVKDAERGISELGMLEKLKNRIRLLPGYRAVVTARRRDLNKKDEALLSEEELLSIAPTLERWSLVRL